MTEHKEQRAPVIIILDLISWLLLAPIGAAVAVEATYWGFPLTFQRTAILTVVIAISSLVLALIVVGLRERHRQSRSPEPIKSVENSVELVITIEARKISEEMD